MRIFCVVGLLLGSRVSTNFAAGVSSSAIIKEALESAGKIDNDDEKADMLKNIVMIQRVQAISPQPGAHRKQLP